MCHCYRMCMSMNQMFFLLPGEVLREVLEGEEGLAAGPAQAQAQEEQPEQGGAWRHWQRRQQEQEQAHSGAGGQVIRR